MIEFTALSNRYNETQNWLNHRAALICSVIANVHRDPKRKSKPYVTDDFMPTRERKVMTDQQMYDQVKACNLILGGKVIEV